MNKMKVLVLASLVALVAFTGCQNPFNPGQGGTLTVSMNDAVSRSILPGISMNPESYDLAGTGPNGASFAQTVSNGRSATMTDLAFGSWTVTATAKNAAGTAIGQGSGSVTVLSNTSVSLAITVRPYEGFGTLALNVSWPAAQVQTAQIQSTLTPASGSARDLTFAVNGSAGTASFSASDVATGYHTLILKLLDNGHLAIGAVEVVRIVKDQTTSGTLAFANVNQATGTLEVNLTPEMSDPLDVRITGSAATKPVNQSMSLSAAVSNYSDNVTYVWYVNGDAVATGASYSFGDTLAQGYYRIDVTAFSADGKRAGSTTTSVQVTAPETADTIFNPHNMIVVKESVYPLSGYFASAGCYGNYVYSTLLYRGLGTYDVSDVNNPVLIDTNTQTLCPYANVSFVKDSNLYLLYSGAMVYSLTDPAKPVLTTTINGGYVNNYLLDGDTLYLASNYSLNIIDTSDPANVRQLGSISIPNNNYALAKSGTTLVALNQKGVLDYYDISDPSMPSLISSGTGGSSIQGIAAVNGFLYVSGGDSQLSVYNLSDPLNPVQTQTVSQLTAQLIVVGNYLYAFSRQAVTVYDISTPDSIQSVDTVSFGMTHNTSPYSIFQILGDWLTWRNNGYVAINISDPANPTFVTEATGDYYYGIAKNNNALFVPRWGYGLEVNPINASGQVTSGTTVKATGRPFHLNAKGNALYLSDEFAGLKVLDISDGANPMLVKQILNQRPANSVSFNGDLGYIGFESNGITVIDASDPLNPVSEYSQGKGGSIGFPWGDFGFVGNTLLYTSWASKNLYYADISAPPAYSNIRQVAVSDSTVNSLGTLRIHGNYAYVAMSGGYATSPGLGVFDVSNPNTPVYVTALGHNHIRDIAFKGNYLYVIGSQGLDIFDLTDPASPLVISSLPALTGSRIIIDGNYAYIGGNGISVVDISDISNMTVVKTATLPNLNVKGMVLKPDYLYVASDTYGITVVSGK